ncbi:heat shock factor protein-like isoform X2 [Halichondria panicea]|uniref:heat shock factor protein-like isoform X2 n=1 Tax=Halichondria panicea TaxID=6063 RepID=UPI00312B89BC
MLKSNNMSEIMALTGARPSPPSGEEELKEKEAIAIFITKVWKIVESPEYNKYIHWSDNGKTFVVCDYPNFAREVLPHYFKHSNFSSFVRQLNLYGFRKVSHPDEGALIKTQANETFEFWQTNFRRGHHELLHLVQRKPNKHHHAEGGEELKPEITKVLGDIHTVQGRQENIMLVLDALKQDNQHLHMALKQLKEKSARQQKVLNKVIQFLVHMVYKGKLPGRRTSNNQLMLMEPLNIDGPPSPKRMRPMTIDNELASIVEYNDYTPNDLLDMPPLVSVVSPDSVQAPSPAPGSEYSGSARSPLKSVDSPTLVTPVTPITQTSTMSPLLTSSSTVTSLTPSTTYTTLSSSLPAESSNDDYALALVPLIGGGIQLPAISQDLFSEYPIHPAPSSLLNSPHPDNRLCINGQVSHQQNCIDAIPEMVTDNLSLDPGLLAEFLASQDHSGPCYDYVDTARLLESLTNLNQDTVTHESTLYQQLNQQPLSLTTSTPSQDASELEKLLNSQ